MNELPCRSTQCHVGAEQQHLTAVRAVSVAAHAVVAAQCDFVGGHVVIGDRAGRSHRLGILGEDAPHHLHPIRLEHAVGIHASENVAGGMVESVVSRRNETLLLILMEQLDREVRMFGNVALHDFHGMVGGTVVHHEHLVRHHRLAGCVVETIDDAFLFVPRWDDD